MKSPSRRRDNAVSEIIGTILIFSIFVSILSGLIVWYVPYSGQQNENQYEINTQQSLSNFANQLNPINLKNGSAVSGSIPLGIQGVFLTSTSQSSLAFENNFNISVHYNVGVGVSYSGNTPPNLVQNKIISEVPVGNNPDGVVVDTTNNLIFVANSNYNSNTPGSLTVLSGATDQPVKSVALIGFPTGIAFDTANNLVFVTEGNLSAQTSRTSASFTNGFIQAISGSSLKVVKTLPFSSLPYDITYVPYLNEMMFTIVYPSSVGYGGSVVSLNTTGFEVSGYIQLSPPRSLTLPSSISYDPANGYVYVALGTSIAIINPITAENISQILVNTPWSLAFDTSNGFIFGTSSYIGNNYEPISDSQGQPVFYVINGTNNKFISTINAYSNINGQHLDTPTSITFDSANHFLYMTDFQNSAVWVINGLNGKLLTTISGYPGNAGPGNGPNAIAYDPLNGQIYVPNWNLNTVTVISGDTVLSDGSSAFGSTFAPVATVNGSGQISASANTPFIPQRTIAIQDGYVLEDYPNQYPGQIIDGIPLTLSHNSGLVALTFNVLNLSGLYFSVSQTGNFLLNGKVNSLFIHSIHSGEALSFNSGGTQYTANVTDIILNNFTMTIHSSDVPLWNYTFYKQYNNSLASFNPVPSGTVWDFAGLPFIVHVTENSITISTIEQSLTSAPLLVNSFDLSYLGLYVNY